MSGQADAGGPGKIVMNPVPYVVTIAGLVAALYYGAAIFRPLALAMLFAVLLTAASETLEKFSIGGFRLPKWMSMSISIGIVILGLLLVAQILSGQANDVAAAWPRYVARLEAILSEIAAWLHEDVAKQVKLHFAKLDLSSSISTIASKTGSIIADMVVTGLYVAFLLASKNGFAQKLASIFPDKDEHRSVQRMILAASVSIRKYLLIKTIMSVITGLLSYAVLKLLGVDFAETWALFIFLLNYIPTVGSIIGVVFPAILALVQFDTLGPFLTIAVLLTGAQFTIGNVIEPIYMGKVLNLSSVVVIVALSLWGTVWGIVGMFMSVPITVVLMILCAHVPALRWIAVLLSEDGKLAGETP
jgi:AI-2 transport protein TqsA